MLRRWEYYKIIWFYQLCCWIWTLFLSKQFQSVPIMGPVHDPVTWFEINYAESQIWKQCKVGLDWWEFLCFGSPTVLFASQHNLFSTMWPDRGKGLYNIALGHASGNAVYLSIKNPGHPAFLHTWLVSVGWAYVWGLNKHRLQLIERSFLLV